MTTLATETFTGANGSAWGAQWTTGMNQGTATIQSNAGRLLPSNIGYLTVQRFLNIAAAGKCELYVEVTLPAITEQYVYVFIRADSSQTGQYFATGYGVVLKPGDGTYYHEAAYGSGEYLQTAIPMTYVAGGRYGVRVNADGFTWKSKVWDLSGAEPTAWMATATDTDSAFPTGRVELASQSGQSSNPGVSFDNLTYTDGATAPAYSGTLSRTLSATAAFAGTPKPTGALSRLGTSSLTLQGSPTTAGSLARSGSVTTTFQGNPSVKGDLARTASVTSTLTGAPTFTDGLDRDLTVTSSAITDATFFSTLDRLAGLNLDSAGTATLTDSLSRGMTLSLTLSGVPVQGLHARRYSTRAPGSSAFIDFDTNTREEVRL